MACLNPDGTLTPSAQAVIAAARTPMTPEEIAQHTHLPLYRIRSSLRELLAAGLLIERTGRYQTTDSDIQRLPAAG